LKVQVPTVKPVEDIVAIDYQLLPVKCLLV